MTIPNIPLANPRHLFVDENNIGLDNGRVIVYEAGTTSKKTIYADKTQDTEITNPVILGAGGFIPSSLVWIPEGRYDMLVQKRIGTDEFGDPEYEDAYPLIEDLAGAGTLGGEGGGSVSFIESVDELRALTAGITDLVYLAGYYQNDGIASKFFHWDELSNDVDDGGSVISPNGSPATGRWIANFATNKLTMQDFGVREGSEYSNASQVEKMILFAQSNLGYVIDLNMGEVYLNGNVDFSGDISVIVREGCRFRGTSGVHTLTFSCQNLTIESRQQLAEQFPLARLSLVVTSDIEVRPQWWGAVEGTGTNSSIYFEAMNTQSGTNDILVDSPFYIESSDFSSKTIIKEAFGRIDIGGPITIGKVVSESRIFSGDFSDLTFSENVINGEWFFLSGTLDTPQWTNFIDSCASNGTKLINWNSGSYEFTTAYTPTSSDVFKLSFNVAPNVLFKATSVSVAMPKVISKGYCFDNTSTGQFYFNNQILGAEVYLSQFGATPEDPTSLNSAVYLAVKSFSKVNLDGQTYYPSLPIILDDLADKVYFKKGTFYEDSSFVGSALITNNKTTTFESVSLVFTIADIGFYQSGSSAKTFFRNHYSETSTTKSNFFDEGTLNYVSISNSEFVSGSIDFNARLVSGSVSGNYFNNTIFNINDPDNIDICSNNFYRGTSSHSINLSIANGQTATRNGIVITNNTYKGLSRNYFVTLTDGNANFGLNYGIVVKDNMGTDVSTEYNLEAEVDLTIPNYPILIEDYINWTAMQNSGFFSLNSAVTGVSTSSGSGTIETIFVEPFNSDDTTSAITYTDTGTGITQTIYATLRRV